MKSQTKPMPYASNAVRSARFARMKRRETWMPKLQAAMVLRKNTTLFR